MGLDSLSLAHMKKDVYARPQLIGVVKGVDQADVMQQFQANKGDFITAFKALEIDQTQERFKRSY